MATTVHIPEKLLRSVDRVAKRRKVSRNRLIVEALEKAIADSDRVGPSAGFLEYFREQRKDPEHRRAVAELFDGIEKQRKSSKPIIKL